jgi:hypothetical protein
VSERFILTFLKVRQTRGGPRKGAMVGGENLRPRKRARRTGQTTINRELESSVGPRGYLVGCLSSGIALEK